MAYIIIILCYQRSAKYYCKQIMHKNSLLINVLDCSIENIKWHRLAFVWEYWVGLIWSSIHYTFPFFIFLIVGCRGYRFIDNITERLKKTFAYSKNWKKTCVHEILTYNGQIIRYMAVLNHTHFNHLYSRNTIVQLNVCFFYSPSVFLIHLCDSFCLGVPIFVLIQDIRLPILAFNCYIDC
jgi:hypothetical protein